MELTKLYDKIKQLSYDLEQLSEVCEDYGFDDYFKQAQGSLTDLKKLVTRDLPMECEYCGCDEFVVLKTIKISKVQPPDLLPGQELLGVFNSTRFRYVCSQCDKRINKNDIRELSNRSQNV